MQIYSIFSSLLIEIKLSKKYFHSIYPSCCKRLDLVLLEMVTNTVVV